MGRHATSIALFVAIVAVTLGAQSMRAVERVSIDELKAFMASNNVVIIDVRTPEEFKAGHIPGAINFNYTTIAAHAEKFNGEKRPIVAYCACANEMTAARASVDLAAKGVSGVRALKGGWEEWVERKEKIEK